MPINYAQYFVDPRPYTNRLMEDYMQGQVKANDFRLANRRADQQDRSLGIQEQGLDLQRQRLGLAERGMNLEERMGESQMSERAQKVVRQQLSFIANGLDSVKDGNSYQSFRNIVLQMVQSGMLPPDYAKIPEKYEPEKIKQARDTLKAALGDTPEWGEPKPIPGGRGAVGITSGRTGETKSIVGQAISRGGDGHSPQDSQTLNQRVMNVERMFDDLTRDYIDPEFKMYRQGPKDDPDLYRRLGKQALDAKQKDIDLLQTGKEPHYIKDLITKATEVEKAADVDWGTVELPSGVTREDVEYTAKQHGISAKEVLKRIGTKNAD